MNRVARTAFWTLCVCAYTLALWCIVALLTGVHWLPFDNAGYAVFGGWTKDALFTYSLCFIVSVALLPFVFFFWRSRRIVLWGLGASTSSWIHSPSIEPSPCRLTTRSSEQRLAIGSSLLVELDLASLCR